MFVYVEEFEFLRFELFIVIVNEFNWIFYYMKFICFFVGFFERIYENRKKYIESEGEFNCYDYVNCCIKVNKL